MENIEILLLAIFGMLFFIVIALIRINNSLEDINETLEDKFKDK
jgi:hypothetical protein